MAFRLDRHLRSGVIDSSVRGRVTGELIIEGLPEPITLDLEGNPHPDMAGCVLHFRNPNAKPIDLELADGLRTAHRGFAGDLSASQKRRVPPNFAESRDDEIDLDVSTYVWKNILYLEWYDAYNGRVVIEGVDYEWEIDLPRWSLTEAEIMEQARRSSDAMSLYMNLAIELFEDTNEEIRAEERKIDPDAVDEFAWEKRLKLSEERTDAFMSLLGQAETDEERSAIFERIYGGRRRRDDETDEYDEADFDQMKWDEADAAADSHRVEADPGLRNLAVGLRLGVEAFLRQLPDFDDDRDAASAEWFTFFVKVRTLVSLLLSDLEEGGDTFEPGFIIALTKREIARAQALVAYLQSGAPDDEKDLREPLWKLREGLIELAGRLRSG